MKTNRRTEKIRWFVVAFAVAALLVIATPDAQAQRDRGFNQPGAAGNMGGGRDAGFNQPGRMGNNGFAGVAAHTRAVADPGFNQAGAAETAAEVVTQDSISLEEQETTAALVTLG